MITTAIINSFIAVINFIINLLPTAETLPTDFTNAWNMIINFIANLYWAVPEISNILVMMGIFVTLEIAIFIFTSVDWIYTKIRG